MEGGTEEKRRSISDDSGRRLFRAWLENGRPFIDFPSAVRPLTPSPHPPTHTRVFIETNNRNSLEQQHQQHQQQHQQHQHQQQKGNKAPVEGGKFPTQKRKKKGQTDLIKEATLSTNGSAAFRQPARTTKLVTSSRNGVFFLFLCFLSFSLCFFCSSFNRRPWQRIFSGIFFGTAFHGGSAVKEMDI